MMNTITTYLQPLAGLVALITIMETLLICFAISVTITALSAQVLANAPAVTKATHSTKVSALMNAQPNQHMRIQLRMLVWSAQSSA